MTALPQHIQELDLDTEVMLFRLYGYNLLSPSEEIRFSNHVGVNFGGKSYAPVACGINAEEYSSEGSQPEIELTVADTDLHVTNLIYQYNNLEGAWVSIQKTYKKYLDGQVFADPTALLSNSVFRISRRSAHLPGQSVIFVLGNPADWNGVTLPSQYVLTKCGTRYRGPICGYAGAAKFTIADQPTLDPSKDQCSKALRGCQIRFGDNVDLPFFGYPSVSRR